MNNTDIPNDILADALQASEVRARQLRRDRNLFAVVSLVFLMLWLWMLLSSVKDVPVPPPPVSPTIPPAVVECAALHAIADESAMRAASSLATITAPTPAPTSTPVPPGVELGGSCFSEDLHLTEMWKVFCSGNRALVHDEYQQWLCNTAIELSNP